MLFSLLNFMFLLSTFYQSFKKLNQVKKKKKVVFSLEFWSEFKFCTYKRCKSMVLNWDEI